ncbi:MAG: choice-of-anchor tandem repeat GloVer-containing protein [Candidatus Cybelea sp.]
MVAIIPLNAGRHIAFACALLAALAGCTARELNPQPPAVQPQTRSDAQSYRILYNFQGYPDEGWPQAGLVAVGPTLYGTTQYGGTYDDGTVFSLHRGGGWKVLLYSFRGGSDGANPVAGLLDVNGTLYGTTQNGGAYGQGTVFSINAKGREHVLHSFGSGYDGAQPVAGLTLLKGKLYGTTHKGGAYGYGTVFGVSLSGAEHVLHSFSEGYSFGTDGGYPIAGLIVVNGMLYGVTPTGGKNAAGIMYAISIGGTEQILYTFDGGLPAAREPQAPLLLFKGTLYGTAGGGTNDYGAVYSIGSNGENETVLHSFGSGSSDGRDPITGLIVGNGKLYGTTNAGGAGGYGTIYGITTTGDETVLHSFGSGYQHDGLNPEAGLIDVKGSLYGTTYYGGVSDAGTVFTLKL